MPKKKKEPVFQVSPEDQKLLDACQMLNYQQIITAIHNGADVNALDRKHQMAVIDIIAETALDFVSDEIQFLENCDEENRSADLKRLEHLYDQMVRHGAMHFSELKENQEIL